jgi:hypothetical protein
MSNSSNHSGFPGGLGIGQAWRDAEGQETLRIVTIDPVLNVVESEDRAGAVLRDTIDHFLETHEA